MINFTIGHVQNFDTARGIGGENAPYFRAAEFFQVMPENERLMPKFVKAPSGSLRVFIAGFDRASMEAVVINLLTPEDRAQVVNGGSGVVDSTITLDGQLGKR